MIVSGSTSQSLAADLAAELDEPLAPVEYDRFPDGELFTATPGFDADRAVVVSSTTSSDAHLELLQLQDAVREAGADEVITVLPYMGYARQDKPVGPGETVESTPPGYPLSARAVAKAISTGTDRVITVNPHEELVCDFFDVPATAVDAAGRLAEPLPADLVDPLFLSPDDGAIGLAESARDAYGDGEVDHFEKTRLSGDAVSVTGSDASIEGRDVVLVDDIVATGSTMSETIEILGERGAVRTFVTCVHPVLAENARTKLARAGVVTVYGTDTIERPASAVSAAPVIADEL
jgi:ribose-phosphate pyrophosphokinase